MYQVAKSRVRTKNVRPGNNGKSLLSPVYSPLFFAGNALGFLRTAPHTHTVLGRYLFTGIWNYIFSFKTKFMTTANLCCHFLKFFVILTPSLHRAEFLSSLPIASGSGNSKEHDSMVGYILQWINNMYIFLFAQVWLKVVNSSSQTQKGHRAAENRDNYRWPSWIKSVTTRYWCLWNSMAWCIKVFYLRGKIDQIHQKTTKSISHKSFLFA